MGTPFRLRALALVCGFALALPAAAVDSNKWRLQFSGHADTDGEIELVLTPREGEAVHVIVAIPKGTGENRAAKLTVEAIRKQFGDALYKSEVDDGEDVLVKARRGTPDFQVVIQRNTTGLRISPDKE
ncbi:hypothetical protein LF41_801 [Lysobacter dokdonensis DS-58]|uniref:Uncharacterized protein n=1 Tax=Lysobacter dokdonensis DS-58 TaxID=1300345 RepID=A0A0A2WPQ3_9GAMM|nr:hypothetical protein [Lysobacter dokdonensis]KGQ20265.1 hypothetical protein LF41_801 [Lysobacter dokdonensis DS-58]